MFCSNCGQKLDDNADFCSACGTEIGVKHANQSQPQKPPQQQYQIPPYIPPSQQNQIPHISPQQYQSPSQLYKVPPVAPQFQKPSKIRNLPKNQVSIQQISYGTYEQYLSQPDSVEQLKFAKKTRIYPITMIICLILVYSLIAVLLESFVFLVPIFFNAFLLFKYIMDIKQHTRKKELGAHKLSAILNAILFAVSIVMMFVLLVE